MGKTYENVVKSPTPKRPLLVLYPFGREMPKDGTTDQSLTSAARKVPFFSAQQMPLVDGLDSLFLAEVVRSHDV